MSGWQPIETCPENTWVLIYNEYSDDPQIHIDRFVWISHDTEEVISETADRRIIKKGSRREREWTADGWGSPVWMPLPEPPKEQS